MDDYTISKMFLRSNIILHMPELTRTDEFSIGKRDERGNHLNSFQSAFQQKIVNLVEANIEQERADIIKQTNEHNQLSAFGSAYVDLANQVQSLVGTFYDRRKGKYPFYKSVQHKDCVK